MAASGRVEVIRSDIRRRDLRLIIAAIEGYADRIVTGGLPSLPSVIGQCGLGSKKSVSKELALQAETFTSSLQEFLCRHLPPSGWNVILGGRIGFAIRGKHQASAVLRATAGEKDAPASSRRSCVLLIYRGPSAIGELPKWLLSAREDRLIETTSASAAAKATEVIEKSLSQDLEGECEDYGESQIGGESPQRKNSKIQEEGESDESNEEEVEEVNGEEREEHEGGRSSREGDERLKTNRDENVKYTSSNNAMTSLSSSLVKIHIREFSVSQQHSHSSKSSKSTKSTTSSSASTSSEPLQSLCPTAIKEWGYLDLSLETQRCKLLEAFERVASKYQNMKNDNIQELAQNLRDELMIMSGPLWHVCVAREDIQVKTGCIPVVQFTADWIMPKKSPTTSGKLRLMGYQLCGPSPPPLSIRDKFIQSSPYLGTAIICLFWMLKSRLCDDENEVDSRTKSPFQEALAQRLCGHQGLEVSTALLFCVLIAIAIAKVVRRL